MVRLLCNPTITPCPTSSHPLWRLERSHITVKSAGAHSLKQIWKGTSAFTLEKNHISAQNAVSQVPDPILWDNTWPDIQQQLISFVLQFYANIDSARLLATFNLDYSLFFFYYHLLHMILIDNIIFVRRKPCSHFDKNNCSYLGRCIL